MRLFIACIVILGLIKPLEAGFQYSFGFDQPTYIVTPGGPAVSLQLRLTETTFDGDVPRLANGGDNGFFQFGLNVNYGTFTGAQSVFTSFTPFGGGLDQPGAPAIDTSVANNVKLQYFTTSLSGLEVGVFGANSTATAVLGTFLFTNPVGLGTTTLSLSDRNPALPFQDNIFADGFVIDSVATYNSSNITAVPEPSSMVFAVVMTAAAAFRYRRRILKKDELSPKLKNF
jgi:hypothetical protein